MRSTSVVPVRGRHTMKYGSLTGGIRAGCFRRRECRNNPPDDLPVEPGIVLQPRALEAVAGHQMAPAGGVIAQIVIGLRESEVQRDRVLDVGGTGAGGRRA